MTLGASLLAGTRAEAAPQYNYGCDACHTMPPLDSANGQRIPATGAFKGNHAGHADSTAQSCVKCHGSGVLVYQTGHRTDDIKVSGNINGSATGSYSRPFLNQTSVPPNPLGSCSNVNCHFERTSPTWGSAVYASPADCNSCHGASPTAGHPVSGSKHGTYYGTGTGSCLKCHTDHSAEAKPFAHATSVTHRGIAVSFNAAPNNGGSYSGPTNDFLPSQSNTFGTCSGLYCHSDGTTKTGPFTVTTAPSWGNATLGCNGCHGGPASLGSPIGTGKHQAHINNPGTLGSNYGCVECHAKTAASDSAIAVTANHVNTFVEYSGAKAGKNYSGGSCSTTYCHTSGKKGVAGVASTVEPGNPSWSGAAMVCNGCHGAKPMGTAGVAFNSVAGEPNYVSSGLAAANSHEKHVGAAGASTCNSCHAKTTTTGTGIVAGGQHVDGFINYTSASASFGKKANKTCSNISCHSGNGKVPVVADAQWGATLNCNGCHGGPAALGSNVINTGAHTQHTNQPSVLGDNLVCAECHSNTVSSNTAIGTPANHMNAYVDYSGAKAGKRSTLVSGTCSATYCHTSGKKGQANMVATVEPAAPNWSSTGMGCNGCHGAQPFGTAGVDFASVAGEPNYVSGTAGSTNANSHKKHVGAAGATTCSNCHSKTTSNGTAIIAGSQHLDRLANYTSANGSFGKAANKSCSNITCHSGNGKVSGVADAQWGDTLLCNGCHGGPASLGTRKLNTGSHPQHMDQATVLGDNLGCVECHSKTVSSDALVSTPLNHLNSFVDYSGVKAGRSTTYSGGTCSATYCHTSGKKGQTGMVATVEPAAPSWGGAAMGCNGCHGAKAMGTAGVAFNSVAGEPNYVSSGLAAANSHEKHVGAAGATTCAKCHAKTTANGTTLIAGNQHLNGFSNYTAADLSFGKKVNKTCSNISCHSGNGKIASVADAQWGVSLGCNGCHGGPVGLPTNRIVTGAHAQHTNQSAVIGDNLACVECHANTVTSDTTLGAVNHMNNFVDYSGVRAGKRSTVVGGTCSATYCHTSGKKGQSGMVATVEPADPNWSGTGMGCNGCHGAKAFGTAGVEFTSVAGEPNYTTGLPGTESANSHKKHVGSGGAATCVFCHSKTTSNGTAIISSSQHLNGFNNFTSGGGKTFYKRANKTCSNISCHSGNGKVAGVADAQWGATLNCNGCHGGPAALGSNILATGSHPQHVNTGSAVTNYGCVECHAQSVSSDTQIYNTLVHADTYVNYSGVKAGKSSTYAGGTCSATYCHTSGKKGQTGMVATVEPANPSWGGTALGCNGCHGAKAFGTAGVAFTSVAGEPNYTSGAQGSASANSHQKHVKAAGATTCVLCHSATVDATGTQIIGSHTNKVADVVAGGTASFGYPGSKTCTNVSCHSGTGYSATNAVWGATLDCKGCHATLSGAHTRHVGTAWGTLPFYNYTANVSTGSDTDGVTWKAYGFGCANCHPVVLANHMNGSVEVELNTVTNAGTLRKKNSAAGLIGSTGTGTVSCSNVYCHENTTTPQWNQTYTAATRCSGCHENAPSTDSHLAHKVGIHYDDIFSGTSGLLPAAGAVGVNAGHGDPAQSTTIGCNICHYTTVNMARNKYNSSCSTASCHGNTTGNNTDVLGASRITNLANHVNGRNDVAFAPTTYIKSKAQVTDANFVNYTGGLGGWNKTRTYKQGASSYDTSKNYLTVSTYSAGSCSNISCHNGVSVHWVNDFGGAQDCTMCHTNL
ncbi:CxxxxCH/CxxCH domain-containing protein [Geomonas paludis]|uniref:CxxxxCH/CxxCH domain-containing protein n=1 Tax=Geomonas paludis TaxID=2740185 RepID=A0ABY4LK79_9BACT|nr:CxxxxCH/CxxCH domain-containing protein [Geomonas paludis]UPU38249.1 CxxxxCH/CxxCH domain-containing protein [Geomonas paludis]